MSDEIKLEHLPFSEAERQQLTDRFWAQAEPIDGDGCRRWKGNATNGHGRFSLRKREQVIFTNRREVAAHLVAWWLTSRTIEKFVDRSCGNTLCVSPEHLHIRTRASRFWQQVDKVSTPDGCWLWQGGTHTFGYGSTTNGSAHRVAYELTFGAIPEGLAILHKCHTPLCCRPDHLSAGTQNDVVQATIKAGRANYARGAAVGLAAFTEDQVAALRRLYATLVTTPAAANALLEDLATLTNVSNRAIWRIVNGTSYQEEPKK